MVTRRPTILPPCVMLSTFGSPVMLVAPSLRPLARFTPIFPKRPPFSKSGRYPIVRSVGSSRSIRLMIFRATRASVSSTKPPGCGANAKHSAAPELGRCGHSCARPSQDCPAMQSRGSMRRVFRQSAQAWRRSDTRMRPRFGKPRSNRGSGECVSHAPRGTDEVTESAGEDTRTPMQMALRDSFRPRNPRRKYPAPVTVFALLYFRSSRGMFLHL